MRRTYRNLLCFCLVFGGWIGIAADDPDAKPVFRAGAATSNITPPLGEMIIGGWTPIPAAHIHDELFARCLVLDDGATKLAIVLCDNVGIPREVFDLAKQQIQQATDIPPARVLLASTHTHSATTARGPSKVIWQDELTDYQTFVAGRISDGVRRALNQLEPAQIGWGSVDEDSEVFNRRWFVADPSLLTNPFGGTDQVRMNPPRASGALIRPAGPIDPEVSFVAVRSTSGRPLALLANYSLHYVGGVRPGDVSADYFGYFADFIAEKLGARNQAIPFVAMMSNGTSGDINNINFRARSPRKERYEKMQEVAEKLASRVHEGLDGLNYQDWVPLDAAAEELTLKVRRPTAEMLAHLAAAKAASDEESQGHRRTLIYAERMDRLKHAPETIDVPLQVVRIGELAISAIPFETFVEIGIELKEETPFRRTFTIELANGSFGYLPTPEQHKLGGYETWLGTNFVEQQASNRITETLLKLQQRLKSEQAN